MNCNPTLTADEFKTIHNGICELNGAIQHLEGVLDPELLKRLLHGVSEIRRGLDNAYEQDDSAFESKSAHYERIREELGLSAVWSIYQVDDLGERHSYTGATTVLYTDHWGHTSKVQVPINGLTWAALYVAANAAIRDSGDTHNVYIEDFKPSEGDVTTLRLTTGS
jgi:hypothetical protein